MRILSTRKSSAEEIRLARSMGLELLDYPLTRIEFTEKPVIGTGNPTSTPDQTGQAAGSVAVVFTSKNGVEGFRRLLKQVADHDEAPDIANLSGNMDHVCRIFKKNGILAGTGVSLSFYAVGNNTALHLRRLGFRAATPEKENGFSLARKIISDQQCNQVIHFCGNRRRKELSDELRKKCINVQEIIVYKTLSNPQSSPVPENIAAVLFFSPGAVQEFRRRNLDKRLRVPCIAIGETTAGALKEIKADNVIISPEASAASMFEMAINLNYNP